MNVYAIVIRDHPVSEAGFKTLIESSKKVGNDFEIERWNATTPNNIHEYIMEELDLKWNWPDKGIIKDTDTGLRKHAYGGPPLNRRACAISHFLIWYYLSIKKENAIILEHDAKFIKKLDSSILTEQNRFHAIGLNDPRGATRLANKFHSIVQAHKDEVIIPVPTIDKMEVPQGLAGGSAYYLTSTGATLLTEAVDQFGLWPNDAILCQQLFNFLGVTTTYYTTVQGLKSTTFSEL